MTEVAAYSLQGAAAAGTASVAQSLLQSRLLEQALDPPQQLAAAVCFHGIGPMFSTWMLVRSQGCVLSGTACVQPAPQSCNLSPGSTAS